MGIPLFLHVISQGWKRLPPTSVNTLWKNKLLSLRIIGLTVLALLLTVICYAMIALAWISLIPLQYLEHLYNKLKTYREQLYNNAVVECQDVTSIPVKRSNSTEMKNKLLEDAYSAHHVGC
jgi:hypothetical protein